ncbi:tetrahydrofolate dehydrogenase/cyclohydrolase [Pycnococcus provasolii]
MAPSIQFHHHQLQLHARARAPPRVHGGVQLQRPCLLHRRNATRIRASSSGAASIIDGKLTAGQIRQEVALAVSALTSKGLRPPGLAVVLVGERKDSATYVRNKKLACEEAGIVSFGTDLPDTATQQQVIDAVKAFADDPNVDGILVQLPLPDGMDERAVLSAVPIEKDVDGFDPLNLGMLATRGTEPLFVPCTAAGCLELLQRYDVPIRGKVAAVVGRSNIVGTPTAMLLQNAGATVTVVHSQTPDAKAVCANADIVVAACGVPEMVRGDWIKPGAAVIDVGINAKDDPTKKRGYRLVGDVAFDEAKEVAGAITPVPGGVGPMTIAMLLKNTLDARMRSS